MMIPMQLMIPGLRFIQLGDRDSPWAKRPIEKDYYMSSNYNSFEMIRLLQLNPTMNYGVITGMLVVIDFDDAIFQSMMEEKLPDTFIVSTAGKGLKHYYYLVDEPFPTVRINLGKKRVADILAAGNYVVGAGSMIKDKKYHIFRDVPITKTKRSRLKEVFGKWWPESKMDDSVEYHVDSSKRYYDCWDILKKLNVRYNVIRRDGKFIRGIDPVYGISNGNKHNFFISFDGRGWYSFHSAEGGNPTKLLSYLLRCSIDEAIYQLARWRADDDERGEKYEQKGQENKILQ